MEMARFQTYLKDSDVVVTIHRGIDQIGGCITEISTKTSRVFVDFGQNLPGCAVPTTPEQDEALVRDIFAQNIKKHQAVVYTHAHEDHVGLFDLIPCDMPQYIGVGGQELMLANFVKNMCQGLSSSEVLLIYSAWDGYYKDPLQVKQNPAYRVFREAFSNVVDIHTSGHASKECIKKVIDIVKPKEVICIHKEAGAEL